MARYALSDLHGCIRTFRTLVEKGISLQVGDALYLLGDYINKGPDSKGVLDYIFKLQAQGHQVLCLRGNHDQMLVDAYDQGASADELSETERELTLASFGVHRFSDVPEVYVNFVRGLPFFHQLPDFVLVHAGFDFTKPEEAMWQDHQAMLNIKEFKVDKVKLGGRRLLHGHNPQPVSALREVLQQQGDSLNLDTGCVYHRNPEYGHMAALDLDTLALTTQVNLDQPYPVKVK